MTIVIENRKKIRNKIAKFVIHYSTKFIQMENIENTTTPSFDTIGKDVLINLFEIVFEFTRKLEDPDDFKVTTSDIIRKAGKLGSYKSEITYYVLMASNMELLNDDITIDLRNLIYNSLEELFDSSIILHFIVDKMLKYLMLFSQHVANVNWKVKKNIYLDTAGTILRVMNNVGINMSHFLTLTEPVFK